MDILDSSLEALALNYLSFGFLAAVNSFWAWIAVVTAAISIWRLKAIGATSVVVHETASPPSPATSSYSICRSTVALDTLPPESSADLLASAVPTTCTRTAREIVDDDDGACGGILKGAKFRFCYFEENVEVADEFMADGEWEEVDYGSGEWWGEELRVKKGEMGWYRYQDLMKLNGNVVKYWDGGKARAR